MLISSSCEDMMGHYLDKAPGVDVTLDFLNTTKCRNIYSKHV